MSTRNIAWALVLGATLWGCNDTTTEPEPDLEGADTLVDGKGDEFRDIRHFESHFTDPHCDVCTNADKTHLLANSEMMNRVIELIDGAESSVEVAQFTFSRKQIEEALLRAHERGIEVRVAMNAGQAQGNNPSTRLRDAGVDVKFVAGKDNGSYKGLQHAKFMIVDDDTIAMGSNNFSSTGFSINEENTLVLASEESDPMLQAFNCYFDHMYSGDVANASTCSNADARFTPSTHPWKMLRDEMRGAQTSIDVLMHHLLFSDAVKELAKAAERGVRVRVVVNAEDRGETNGAKWDRLRAAGGEVRYKRTNPELYQFMHDKLAIVDGKTLLDGSGNWSGSAFFNNWEFYVRVQDASVLQRFNDLYRRIWSWSLTAESLDAGITPREQDVSERVVYFGNLHAHFHGEENGRLIDDGKLEREIDGEVVDVTAEADGAPMRYAFEYSRDTGGLDFLALSPHVVDDRADDPPDIASMTPRAYEELIATAASVTDESSGGFVALPSFEWSTNSTGNHVNVFGSQALSKVERGDFATFYEGFLTVRREEGDSAWLMLNHPRTFRTYDSLNGSWDQIFGVNLLDIPNASDRSKKFNDFGLDDFAPLSDVRDSWIAGEAMPDEAVVRETMAHLADVTALHHRLMEVTVSRGTEFKSESAQNPSLSFNEETMEMERYHKVHRDFDYFLSNGWQLAPVASQDNHAANWGAGHTSRTAVIAENLTEAALLDAIGDRAVYASEDENLEIRLYAEDRVRAGGKLRTIEDTVALQLFLDDPDFDGPFRVSIWSGAVGGEATLLQEVELTAAQWHTLDAPVSEGENYVYVEVLELEPNRMAWSAPVFVTRE